MARLRQVVALPGPAVAELGLPAAAIEEPRRKRFFNKRRRRDPLGEGFACTWRTRLIKVAAEVVTRSRRIIVRLSGSWPRLDHFLAVGRAIVARPPNPGPG